MAAEIISRADARARGLRRYFTGNPCLEGHLGDRLVSNCACIPCAYLKSKKRKALDRAQNPDKNKKKCKEWYHANLERARERAKIWRDKNPDKVRAQKLNSKQKSPEKYRTDHLARCRKWKLKDLDRAKGITRRAAKKWRQNHPEKAALAVRAWRQSNKDKVRERSRRFRQEHPEKAYAAVKRWIIENRDKWNLICRRRRARKHGASGSHTASDIQDILKLQNGKCAYCRVKFCDAIPYTVDHITPLSRGGSDDRRNLQLVCSPCNGKKWANDSIDFARRLGKLI